MTKNESIQFLAALYNNIDIDIDIDKSKWKGALDNSYLDNRFINKYKKFL
jgi:hypothetical protein